MYAHHQHARSKGTALNWLALRVQGLVGKGLPSSLFCLPSSMLQSQERTLPILCDCHGNY